MSTWPPSDPLACLDILARLAGKAALHSAGVSRLPDPYATRSVARQLHAALVARLAGYPQPIEERDGWERREYRETAHLASIAGHVLATFEPLCPPV